MSSRGFDTRSSASRGSRRAGHGPSPLSQEYLRTRGETASGADDADASIVRGPSSRSGGPRSSAGSSSSRTSRSRGIHYPGDDPNDPNSFSPPLTYVRNRPHPRPDTDYPEYVDLKPEDARGTEMFSTRDYSPEASKYLRNTDMFQPTVSYRASSSRTEKRPGVTNITNNYYAGNVTYRGDVNYGNVRDHRDDERDSFGFARDRIREARDKAEKTMAGYAKYFANADADRRLEGQRRLAITGGSSSHFNMSRISEVDNEHDCQDFASSASYRPAASVASYRSSGSRRGGAPTEASYHGNSREHYEATIRPGSSHSGGEGVIKPMPLDNQKLIDWCDDVASSTGSHRSSSSRRSRR